MPNLTDATNRNPARGRNSGPALRKNVHGHDASPALKRIQLYRTRPLLPHSLPGIPHAPERERASTRRMDLSRCSLLMGHPHGDRLRQRQALHCHAWIPGAEIPHQAHTHQRIQLTHKWNSRTLALRRPTSTLQSRRWRSRALVTSCTLCILVGARHSEEEDGVCTILRSHGHPPPSSVQYHRG